MQSSHVDCDRLVGRTPGKRYQIHKKFPFRAELAPVYETNKGSYKALKEALIADIESLVAPMRESAMQSLTTSAQGIKEGSDKPRLSSKKNRRC